jgi:hypothetical protein
MKEGMYSIAFRGKQGGGWGVLVFESGRVWGADQARGLYDGEYDYNQHTDTIDARIDVKFDKHSSHEHIALVTGVDVPPEGTEFSVDVSLPRELDKPTAIRVEVLGQPVAVEIRKIRDAPFFY